MSSDALLELSPEPAYARRLAAKELARYCQEFTLWRMRIGYSAGSINDLRIQEERFPHLMQQRDHPEPDPAAQL